MTLISVTVDGVRFVDDVEPRGPTPVRARAVEEALTGGPATVDAVTAAAERAAVGARPSDDIFASHEYRTHLATVLTRRAVAGAGGIRAA